MFRDKEGREGFIDDKGEEIFKDEENFLHRHGEHQKNLLQSINNYKYSEPKSPILESTLYDIDDIVEDVPLQDKKKLYDIVNYNVEDNQLFNKINDIDIDHIPKFNILLNELSEYKEKDKILQYILLIDQESKQKRCPNGSRRKVVNCMKIKKTPKKTPKKRCPNGSRIKEVYCLKDKTKKKRCPNGSHIKEVYCLKVKTKKKKIKNCDKYKK